MLVIIDNGHGALINGTYQTKGKRKDWEDKGIIYEGEFNRAIVGGIIEQLTFLKIPYVNIAPEYWDVRLETRVKRANKYPARSSFYLSIHSNAGGGHGSEIFTSPGNTKSDKIATVFGEEYQNGFKIISPTSRDKIILSKHLDEDKIELIAPNIKLEKDTEIEFKILKGNVDANDEEGNITIKAKGIEIISEKKSVTKLDGEKYDYGININDVQYGWTIKVKLLERTLEKGAYLDFYANDCIVVNICSTLHLWILKSNSVKK